MQSDIFAHFADFDFAIFAVPRLKTRQPIERPLGPIKKKMIRKNVNLKGAKAIKFK